MAHSAPSYGGDSGVIEEAPLHGDDRTRVVCCPSSFVHFNTSSTSTTTATMSFDLQQALAQLQAAYDASSEQVSTQLAKLKVSRHICARLRHLQLIDS